MRTRVSVPAGAAEGLGGVGEGCLAAPGLPWQEDADTQQLEKIDGEGRCVLTGARCASESGGAPAAVRSCASRHGFLAPATTAGPARPSTPLPVLRPSFPPRLPDHGKFVLFNVYGPAVCSDDERGEERLAFKVAFLEVMRARDAGTAHLRSVTAGPRRRDLRHRMFECVCVEGVGARPVRPAAVPAGEWLTGCVRSPGCPRPPSLPVSARRIARGRGRTQALIARARSLVEAGRNVVILGDLNVSPELRDRAEHGEGLLQRADGRLLRAAMTHTCAAEGRAGQGWLVDAFRLHHPYRRDAYTCWNPAKNARLHNW